jgi:putative phosphoribosyl transferase
MLKKLIDRTTAGRELAKQLAEYANQSDVLILALPRGGVPVAFEIAKALHLPLDVCLVRKLGAPGNSELAMGAIASGGIVVINEEIVRTRNISQETLALEMAREQQELERRERLYRSNRETSAPPDIRDRTLILVDDGIATGSTLLAAIATLKPQHPRAIVVAVPVLPPNLCQEISSQVDRIVYLLAPDPFYCIGMWYDDFSQTPDKEVCRLLVEASNKQQITNNK